jgi:hypothetical protein
LFSTLTTLEAVVGLVVEYLLAAVDVFCKAAKEMKLKRLDRDTISRQLDKMIEEGKKAKSDNIQNN